MKIWFDLAHPAHVNFFKPAITILKEEGHEIFISALRRGKLPDIVKREFPDFPVFIVGRHRGTKWSILLEANIQKFIQLFFLLKKNKPDVGLSVCGFLLGADMKSIGKPNIQFNDDTERKTNVRLQKMTADVLSFPVFFKDVNEQVRSFGALKEWAYLSPQYLKVSTAVLAEYGLEAGKYIFVREVSTGSLNYQGQQANVIAQFADRFPKDYRVVLSLEDKKTIGQYPSDWILLKEPVSDIHSLIYYSRCLISSGDSMAREGAMLGVPSVYCGFREMKANRVMVDEGMLVCEQPEHCPALLEEIVSGSKPFEAQDAFRNRLLQQWEDVTLYIIQLIKKYK